MELPQAFTKQYRELLKTEYDAFENALLNNRSYGLRLNPLKVNIADFLEDKAVVDDIGIVKNVPWAKEGFYYNNDMRPGKNPLHEGGAYYIQEPSAMTVVAALDPKPGERICDLCAAPGGKTTHIGGRLKGYGLIVANEIVPDRARILARNVERMGISNCIVTNETPDTMADRFDGFFHKIVVDAPCSGEGMFRKDDVAISEWSPENVAMCSERQKDILRCAQRMIMPGGTLVYSTCTFEPAEDERIIDWFINEFKGWHIESISFADLLSNGHPEWVQANNDDLLKTVRIWPHLNEGEGHFVAKLVKDGEYTILPSSAQNKLDVSSEKNINTSKKKKTKNNDKSKKTEPIKDILQFIKDEIVCNEESFSNEFIDKVTHTNPSSDEELQKRVVIYGENASFLPFDIFEYQLKGLKVIRNGLQLCEIKKDRFEPSHSLAMAMKMTDAKYAYDLCYDDAVKYLRGEALTIEGYDKLNRSDIPSGAYVLIGYKGVSLGWCKYSNNTLKNHYPKGLRKDLKI